MPTEWLQGNRGLWCSIELDSSQPHLVDDMVSLTSLDHMLLPTRGWLQMQYVQMRRAEIQDEQQLSGGWLCVLYILTHSAAC